MARERGEEGGGKGSQGRGGLKRTHMRVLCGVIATATGADEWANVFVHHVAVPLEAIRAGQDAAALGAAEALL